MRNSERHARREPNAVVLDPVKGWYLTRREDPQGEQLKFRGRFVHLLCPGADGELIPVGLPSKTDQTPERVYRARYWPGVRILFGMKPTWMEKLDKGLWLGALGILAFLVFMIMSELGG